MSVTDLKGLNPPFIIHSDVFKMFYLIKQNFRKRDKNKLEQKHFDLLRNQFGSQNILIPSFNYQFSKTKIFDLKKTPSQVGALSNFILNNDFFYRTDTPFFSFLHKMSRNLSFGYTPFGNESVFDYVFKNKGSIIFYGAEINSCTFIHYLESANQPPIYRYDKKFKGSIINGNSIKDVEVEFHVKPNNFFFNYDWNKIFNLLSNKKIFKTFGRNFFGFKTRDIYEIWLDKFNKDQFFFLHKSCKNKVRNKYEKLGRRFQIKDFE